MCLTCINLFGHFLTNEKNRHEINAPGNDYRNLSVNSKITRHRQESCSHKNWITGVGYNFATVAQLSLILIMVTAKWWVMGRSQTIITRLVVRSDRSMTWTCQDMVENLKIVWLSTQHHKLQHHFVVHNIPSQTIRSAFADWLLRIMTLPWLNLVTYFSSNMPNETYHSEHFILKG